MQTLKELYNEKMNSRYTEDINGNYFRINFIGNLSYLEFTADELTDHNKLWAAKNDLGQIIRFCQERETRILGSFARLIDPLRDFIFQEDLLKKLYTWFSGKITDGYAMILFSPLILLYWVIISIPILALTLIFIALTIVSRIWMGIVEYPASIMNKEDRSNIDVWFHD